MSLTETCFYSQLYGNYVFVKQIIQLSKYMGMYKFTQGYTRVAFEGDEKVTEIKFHFAKCKRRSMRKKG